MDAALLRSEIHEYIDQADERFLSLVYGMIQADQIEEDTYELSKHEIGIIEERLEEYSKNPTTGSDWEDVKSRLSSKK